jgi:DNA-binding response OmpR family regulator
MYGMLTTSPMETTHQSLSLIKLLLVEDDEKLARLTIRYLESHGIVVTHCADGPSGLAAAVSGNHDVVLLDLMLPGMDGMKVCREIRARCHVPVIVVTARGEEADRVLGLEIGADDYMTKPISSRELLARVHAQVRRSRGQAGPANKPVVVGGLSIDPAQFSAKLDGRELQLTSYEFSILQVLAERAGRVLSREQLLDLAKGSAEEAFDRSIDGHISRLRQKLGDDPRNPRLLKTVRGVGYVYAGSSESE